MNRSTQEPYVALNGAHGRYIPQLFCNDITKNECAALNIDWHDVEVCQEGPDTEYYWDSWSQVLDNFKATDDTGINWYLYQDGDLWAYPEGYEFDDEF